MARRLRLSAAQAAEEEDLRLEGQRHRLGAFSRNTEIEGDSISFNIDPQNPAINVLDATVIGLDEQATEAGHQSAAAQPELHAVSTESAVSLQDTGGGPLDVENPEILSPFSFTLGSILLGADHTHHQNDFPAPGTLTTEPSSQSNEERLAPCTTLRVDYQIRLSDPEVYVFRNYADNVSHWIDSFSCDRPFHLQIPMLALKCPTLLHACLALSSKQLDLVGKATPSDLHDGSTLRYYRLALSAMLTRSGPTPNSLHLTTRSR